MDIKIYADDLSPLEDINELQNLAQKKIGDALSFFTDRIISVMVYFKDINAEKGGRDKRCLVEVHAPSLPPIMAHADTSNFHRSVEIVADKVEKVVKHKFEKRFQRPNTRAVDNMKK